MNLNKMKILNDPKWAQMSSNEIKWVQTSLNEPK